MCDDNINLVASSRGGKVMTLILYVISNYRTIGLAICKDAQMINIVLGSGIVVSIIALVLLLYSVNPYPFFQLPLI